MEVFYCTPRLLKNKSYLETCGRIYAEKHPFCCQFESCTVSFGPYLVLIIYDRTVKKHQAWSIRPLWDQIHKKMAIVYEEITLRNEKDCKPKIEIHISKLDEVKVPIFKNSNNLNK